MDNNINNMKEIVTNNSANEIKNVLSNMMKHPIKTALILGAVSKAIERVVHGTKRK